MFAAGAAHGASGNTLSEVVGSLMEPVVLINPATLALRRCLSGDGGFVEMAILPYHCFNPRIKNLSYVENLMPDRIPIILSDDLTELARLRGARMARASETEKGKAWAENRIKSLTGQDTITARFMRQDDFEFVPEFKLTIFGNSRPSLRDVDTAIKRRFLILPFDNQPAHRDPELPEKLKAEWPGILSWLILGSLDWQANGLIIPPVMDAATQAYFDAEDTFGQWLSDCCETGPKYADTSESLWHSWSHYAHQLGEDPGSKKGSFAETLCQRGFLPGEKIGPSRKRGYKGVRVREDASAFGDGFI